MHKQMLAAVMLLLGSNAAALAASCDLPQIAATARMKQVAGSNLVTVPVAINGTQKQFLLDIGTRPTVVSQAAVGELGLPQISKLTTPLPFVPIPLGGVQTSQTNVPLYNVKGGGSDVLQARVRVRSFTIGEATGKSLAFTVARDGEIGRSAPFDGRLTNDFFKQYDVEMDFGAMQITWLTPTQCTDADQVAYWANGGVAVVPMNMKDGKIVVPVTIEGHTITAVLDTSSEHTVLRRDVAEQVLGLKGGAPDMTDAGGLKDGVGQPVYRHLFPKISFSGVGGVTAVNVPAMIATNSLTDSGRDLMLGSRAQTTDARIPDLVLGMDVLHQLHLYAVFGQKRLYITQVFFT